MPSAELHKKQAQHNKKFLTDPVFDPKKFLYPDWHIIACFYYILHLVDEKLASINKAYEDIGDHKIRKKLIENVFKNNKYSEVPDLYFTLETYSKTARYKCVNINKFTAQKAVECMTKIEKLLAS